MKNVCYLILIAWVSSVSLQCEDTPNSSIIDAGGEYVVVSGTGQMTVSEVVEEEGFEVPVFPEEPTEETIVSYIVQAIQAGASQSWALMMSLIAFILLFVARLFKLWQAIGKRWAYVAIFILAMVGLIGSKMAGGVSWLQATLVALTTPGIASLIQAFDHGVLGREHKTPVKPS